MSENEIGTLILDAAFLVHKKLGPGLLESAYLKCLCYELDKMNVPYDCQVPLPLIYDDTILIDCGFRLDLCVKDKVIVEIKSVEQMHEVFLAQIITYLKLTNCKLGYLINFNVPSLAKGIKRVVLGEL